MRLVDLNPRWIGAGGEGLFKADGSPAPERHGVGVRFNCPCGQDVCPHPLCYVSFENPLDGGPPIEGAGAKWHREGDTFETLTLTPSISRTGACNWHGYITNGEIINA